MSRLAQKPILIPVAVDVKKDNGVLHVSGPRGAVSRFFRDDINMIIESGSIKLTSRRHDLISRSLLGTYAAHLKNMLAGVTAGFTRTLILEGVGYKVALAGRVLDFDLGFSHNIKVNIPEGLSVTIDKGAITIAGADKEKLGQFTAAIRKLKPVEPYKGKGIRYIDEVVKRKQGKKAVG